MSDKPKKKIKSEIYDSVPLNAKPDPWPQICVACNGDGTREFPAEGYHYTMTHGWTNARSEKRGSFFADCIACNGRGTVIL